MTALSQERRALDVGLCKKHARYKALQEPRVACSVCWTMWFRRLGSIGVRCPKCRMMTPFGNQHDGCDYVYGGRGWRQLGVYDG
jgi:hypothetical protein